MCERNPAVAKCRFELIAAEGNRIQGLRVSVERTGLWESTDEDRRKERRWLTTHDLTKNRGRAARSREKRKDCERRLDQIWIHAWFGRAIERYKLHAAPQESAMREGASLTDVSWWSFATSEEDNAPLYVEQARSWMSAQGAYPWPIEKLVLGALSRDGGRPGRSWSRSRYHREAHSRLPLYSRRPYDLTTASRFLIRCCSCPLTEVGGGGSGGDDDVTTTSTWTIARRGVNGWQRSGVSAVRYFKASDTRRRRFSRSPTVGPQVWGVRGWLRAGCACTSACVCDLVSPLVRV